MHSKKFKLLSDNQLLSVRGGGTPLKTGVTTKPPPVDPPPDGDRDILRGLVHSF